MMQFAITSKVTRLVNFGPSILAVLAITPIVYEFMIAPLGLYQIIFLRSR